MNKIKLTKQSYNRTNILTLSNGNGRQLNKIIFYDDNGIIFENGAILETETPRTTKNNKTYYIQHDLINFELLEPKKKNKIDLTIKQNFFVSSLNYLGDPAFNLYIYCNGGEDTPKIKELEEKAEQMTRGEKYIYKYFLLENINAYILELRTATEKDIKENKYITIDNKFYVREKKEQTQAIIKKFNRIERTSNAEKRREIEKELYKNYNVSLRQAKEIYNIFKENLTAIEEE